MYACEDGIYFEDVSPADLIDSVCPDGFIEHFEDQIDGEILDPYKRMEEALKDGTPVAYEDSWVIYRMFDGALVINMQYEGLDLWDVAYTTADYIRLI